MQMFRLAATLTAKPVLTVVSARVLHAINIEEILHRCLSVDTVIVGKVQLIWEMVLVINNLTTLCKKLLNL